ncbi:MAG: hypothetical protein PHS44_06865 [Candidatus Dojkabacteria bacterium]|jgi:hypothetical protein|nr:hypothetical protein [Candidatus Dojkabacteria bacterium]
MKKPHTQNNKIRTLFFVPIFIILLPLVIVWLVGTFISDKYKQSKTFGYVKRHWFRKGKHILFVYSESPNWKDYIERGILPRIKERAILVNWSKRKDLLDSKSRVLEIYKAWTGVQITNWAKSKRNKFGIVGGEYNPVAVLFPKNGRAKVLKFYKAFKSFKSGRQQELKKLESELFDFCKTLSTKN